MSYRTNDNSLARRRAFNRVEHPVVSYSRRPDPGEPSNKTPSDNVRLDGKVSQRMQHRVTERKGQAF